MPTMIHPLMEKYVVEFLGDQKNNWRLFQTILFTTDGEILEKISGTDEIYVDQEAAQDEEENNRMDMNRPPTAGNDVSPY